MIFNEGIEAAAQELRRVAELHEQSCSGMWSRAAQQRALLKRDVLQEMSNRVRALKRPEPSEEERVEKVAAVIERELMIDEMLLADPTTLRKIKSQRIARAALAALKAMEGE